VETDLGEYIQQLDGEPPYHIVTPAMHKSREDIAKLFAEKLHVAPNLSAEQLTLVARDKLREKYIQAEVGVTGANFILADIGGIAVSENEGNARLSNAFPKTHIVITGIEKVIPSMNDLALFWPLLATYGTGQWITSYNTIICGPRQPNETDGPDEMYVILLDNGRTNILANEIREFFRNFQVMSLQLTPVGAPNIAGDAQTATVQFTRSLVARDSTGRELTTDLDYGEFNSNSLSYNSTSYFNNDGSQLQDDYKLDGDQEGKLILKTVKVDYVHPLKNKSKLEAGGKISFVSSDNDAKFYDVSTGVPVNDVNKTNHFYYKEKY
jgi:hypothetical protein